MEKSMTINCLNNLDTALNTAVFYQGEGKTVQIKGRAKGNKITYFVLVTD
jgi:hypothetical protein